MSIEHRYLRHIRGEHGCTIEFSSSPGMDGSFSVEELISENKRLRKALERIAGVEPWDRFLAEHTRVSIARAALKVNL